MSERMSSASQGQLKNRVFSSQNLTLIH